MTKMLSAIIIIFNFLHILVNGSLKEIQTRVQHQERLQVVNGSVEEIQTQVQHQEHLQVNVTPPELDKKKHKKHPHPHTGPHPHQPQPQPLPLPTQPLPTQPLPRKGLKPHPPPIPTQPQPQTKPQLQPLPIPTPLPTQPQPLPKQPLPRKGMEPHPLPIPTPLPTQPLPHPQVPHQVPLVPIPTPGGKPPKLPSPHSSLREMYDDMTSSKPQAYLASHNEFRAKMGVPPLKWDKKLEDYALAYGQKRAADCRLQHSLGPYGENLFWELYEESGPEQIVKSFADEKQNYDLGKGECKCKQETGKCMCGHFTAIIWKTTERVGCAEVRCQAEKGKLVVCSYDPPGNVIGQGPLHTQ